MSILKSALLFMRFRGLGGLAEILRYTLYHHRLDRSFPGPAAHNNHQPVQTVGGLQNTHHIRQGIIYQFERAQLEIAFLAPDLARLTWTPGDLPVPYALARMQWPPTNLLVKGGGSSLASSAMRISISDEGEVTFSNQEGQVLRRDLPPSRQGTRWKAAWPLSPHEHIYGMGEQAGRLDLRGRCYPMWNTDPGGSYGPGSAPLYMPLPVFYSLSGLVGYLLFFENYQRGTIDLSGAAATAQFEGGALRYYLVPGHAPAALERFSELTGRPNLPPRWSLGYHQSRWGYKTAADIRAVAAGFKAHEMPLSAIHLDIDYMDGYRVFTVDPQRFPDLPGLAAELAAEGVRLVTIVDPGVKEDPKFPVYQDGLKRDVFVRLPDGKPVVGSVWPGRTIFPDFTKPEARAWWSQQYHPLLEAGIAGLWHDMNEPSAFTVVGEKTLPLVSRHDLDGCQGDHTASHNVYGLNMNRAGYEALYQERPDRRPWIVSRSGWVSQQRYAWNWTGDIESSWDALRMTIPTVLGLGLSGQPFSGPDVGGFNGSPSPELYLRFFQLSTFLPFFRSHSAIGEARREPWVFGEPYTRLLRDCLRLRYRLMPYLYTLAWQAAQTGAPLARPLFWTDPGDARLAALDEQFFLGDHLLVAPVLSAGADRRTVILPAGDWYDFWTGEICHGPGEVDLPVTLESIPVFARAGAVLPLQESPGLTLFVYPPKDGELSESILYSDSGDGEGPSRLDRFTLRRRGLELALTRSGRGEYPAAEIIYAVKGEQQGGFRLQVEG